MSLGVRIMVAKAGRPPWTMERQADMTNHNGVLMMQRLLLAGTLGLAVAQKAAAILDGEPATTDPEIPVPPGERWCDALLHLLDLAAFAGDLGSPANDVQLAG
jgi:hypothetical protein